MKKHYSVVIQSAMRGYLTRKKLKIPENFFDLEEIAINQMVELLRISSKRGLSKSKQKEIQKSIHELKEISPNVEKKARIIFKNLLDEELSKYNEIFHAYHNR
tara:strand:- start:225 stop:533 length:309 start_codon:yes stop_codon:yes gene_type:complete